MSAARGFDGHCSWCGQFIARSMPAWTWYRDWPTGERQTWWPDWWRGPLGWTEPQRLCPDHAEAASNWPTCHNGLFAEVTP